MDSTNNVSNDGNNKGQSVVDIDNLNKNDSSNVTAKNNNDTQQNNESTVIAIDTNDVSREISTNEDKNSDDMSYEESDDEESDIDYVDDNDSDIDVSIQEAMIKLRKWQLSNTENLPETVTKLETPDGGIVFIVGTAHFSLESQEDVAKTIQTVKPDIIVLELCKSRVSILQLDEKTILAKSENLNFSKIQETIKQNGVFQGLMNLMLLSMSASLTRTLGMAPGGEFRRAFTESRSIPGCMVHLGDRPIQITLQRALGTLSWLQTFRLAWQLMFNNEPINAEDVEKCKQKDLLEEMLAEMTGDFPALSRVFVNERDVYLTHSLRLAASAATPSRFQYSLEGRLPAVVVGVVGIGHIPGIVTNWNKVSERDIPPLLIVPEKSKFNRIVSLSVKVSVLGLICWGSYRMLPLRVKNVFPSWKQLLSKFTSNK